MKFVAADTLMREGKAIARANWNWISVQKDGPDFVLVTQSGGHQPGWTPSSNDRVADDWIEVMRRP